MSQGLDALELLESRDDERVVGAHECAEAVAADDQPALLQLRECLPQGRATDADALAQGRLGGQQPILAGQRSRLDPLDDLLGRLPGQRRLR